VDDPGGVPPRVTSGPRSRRGGRSLAHVRQVDDPGGDRRA
jgi:hypothetical protein